jgi:hypothetical protein
MMEKRSGWWISAMGVATATLGFVLMRRESLRGGDGAGEAPEPLTMVILKAQAVHENSGMALSRRDPRYFWTHNDSGDRARIFQFDREGVDCGELIVPDAKAVDWEDIASFVRDGEPRLLIADTGDNDNQRDVVTLYEVDDVDTVGQRVSKVRREYRIAWPDGPEDCESVTVDSLRGEILLLTKARGLRAKLGRVMLEQGDEPGKKNRKKDEVKIQIVGKPPIPLATAMDQSIDGTQLVVLTPLLAIGYRREVEEGKVPESWGEVMGSPEWMVPLPSSGQVEAVAWESDGQSWWVGSEGRPSKLWRYAVPPPIAVDAGTNKADGEPDRQDKQDKKESKR